MRKLVSILLAGAMTAALLAGCGKSGGTAETTTAKATEKETTTAAAKDDTTAAETEAETDAPAAEVGGTIEMEVTYSDEMLEKFRAIVEAFEAETGITVELITPGSEYEATMKTRMASNDLPDVWQTHGWSVIRYSDYLMKQTGASWADRMDESALGVISDDNGDYYVACITESCSGLMYNQDVLDAAGVDPLTLTTLEAFEEALAKVKAAGVTPIYIGGSVSGNSAGFLGSIMPAMQTDAGVSNPQGDNLRAGTYDWDVEGTKVLTKLADWVAAGYVNENALTATTEEMQTALGEGTCAFVFRASSNLTNARMYVPDCNVNIIPIPNDGTGAPTYKIGEGSTFGVWKDTKNVDACNAWLEYITRSENAVLVANLDGSIPAIKDANIDDNFAIQCYKESQEKIANINYDNVFDRKYFPSGMWSIMGSAVNTVIDNPTEKGVAEAVDELKESYTDLYEEQHSN